MASDSQRQAASLATDHPSQRASDLNETISVTPPAPAPRQAPPLDKTPIDPLATSPLGLAESQVVRCSGGYYLLSRLGGGSFGEVWNARAPGGFPAAVKVIQRQLEDAQAQRELKSLEAMKELRHPYLLATHACWIDGGRLHIAMELADKTLRGRFKECEGQGGIPLEELFRYFWEAAEALDFLHRNKVLHRDIKPDNLLLLTGHVKVADFGLIQLQEVGQTDQASVLCGTPSYMAPEAWESRSSERSDLYSLAVSYAELRLGRRPFGGTTIAEMMTQHCQGAPDLTGLPEPERIVVRRALAAESHQRYGCCMEFVQTLRLALVSQKAQQATPAALMPPEQGFSCMSLVLLAALTGRSPSSPITSTNICRNRRKRPPLPIPLLPLPVRWTNGRQAEPALRCRAGSACQTTSASAPLIATNSTSADRAPIAIPWAVDRTA